MRNHIRRRQFITFFSGAAAWPLAARAQQAAMPVVAFINPGSASYVPMFYKGLSEMGYVDGQNVKVEYHLVDGQYERLPALLADIVGRHVAVIATTGNVAALAVKAATSTIPIVFAVSIDPVKLGLVASLARPGGNATGSNFFQQELAAKELQFLREMVPNAVRVAVLVNRANTASEHTLPDVQEAARVLGLQIQVLSASTSREIDAAFVSLTRERPDALFIAPDAFFAARRVQLATLVARDRMPAISNDRAFVEAGGLMYYGTNLADTYRQMGIYAGRILKGTKPADLPVVQSTKFDLVINLQTARLLGMEVPPKLLALADEVIE